MIVWFLVVFVMNVGLVIFRSSMWGMSVRFSVGRSVAVLVECLSVLGVFECFSNCVNRLGLVVMLWKFGL